MRAFFVIWSASGAGPPGLQDHWPLEVEVSAFGLSGSAICSDDPGTAGYDPFLAEGGFLENKRSFRSVVEWCVYSRAVGLGSLSCRADP